MVWGTFGMDKKETPSGVLVGGNDSGSVMIWDPAKILADEADDELIVQLDKHTGVVYKPNKQKKHNTVGCSGLFKTVVNNVVMHAVNNNLLLCYPVINIVETC